MNKVGEIILILNKKFAIVRTTRPIILGSEVLAYKEAALNDGSKQQSGLDNVSIPKGKLKVIMQQGENLYILSIIDKNTMEANAENETLARNLSSFKQIFNQENPTGQPSEDEVAPYSARLDESQSVNVDINPLVVIGDSIAYTQSSPTTAAGTPQK
jgi:hypothetical protein